MPSFKTLFTKNKIIMGAALVIVCLYGYFFMNRAYVRITLFTNQSTKLKIYWADENQPYSEKYQTSVRISNRKSNYLIYLTNLKNIRKLRIDPAEQPADIRIDRMEIKQNSYQPILFATPDQFNQFVLLNQIEKSRDSKKGLSLVSLGNDPQLEVTIDPVNLPGWYANELLRLLLFVFLLILVVRYSNHGQTLFGYTPYCMAFVATLIFIMASLSQYNKHPDEYVHVSAGRFYEDHWAPPKICELGTENTYSVYGVSRLNSYELVYFIAGKFSAILGFLPIHSYYRLRLFNVLLFVLLLFLNIKIPAYRAASIPLLLSPQIWYVFSYFNSDAFAVFIAYIAIYQIVHKESLANRYLLATNWKIIVFYGLFLGLLLFIFLTLKKNFYFFVLFILIYLVITLIHKRFAVQNRPLKRVAMVVLVCVTMLGLRYTTDLYINGTDKAEQLLACREKLAKTAYKPSTPLGKSAPGLNLKKKGVPLNDVWTQYRWVEKSFQSSFGVYGYTTILGPPGYYKSIKIVSIMLLMFILWVSLYNTTVKIKLLLAGMVICSATLIAASIWNSWAADFQPQGRYLLPIVPMVAMLFSKNRDKISCPIFSCLVILMFTFSAYSYIFIGLANMPKI